MDRHSLEVLEFDKIVALVGERCLAAPGRELAGALTPQTDPGRIATWLSETAEVKEIITTDQHFPLRSYPDIREHLATVKMEGTFLEPLRLLEVADFSGLVGDLVRTAKALLNAYPLVTSHLAGLTAHSELKKAIEKAIDPSGEIRDSASPALHTLRQQKQKIRREILAKLEAILSRRKTPQAQVTLRDNRYVIPVDEHDLSRQKGIVHDRSASGATFFVEPLETVELNNRLRETEIKERQEIDRILRALSDHVRKHQDELAENLEILAQLDFLRAKARLSVDLNGSAPKITAGAFVSLLNARHPLLLLQAKTQPGMQVIPLDFSLGRDFSCVIVTGPNTGGKTVALKTLGILVLMAQAGLHVPASPDSEIGSFGSVWADIGDEQSIEQSLSTFSSHMSRIIQALSRADAATLVLFDELGVGTDPKEGAALGEAVLLDLLEKKAKIVATTHYSALKTLAQQYPQIRNASLEFDRKTLRPTYRFSLGLPGGSYALEIAERLGMPKKVTNKAAELVGSQERSLVKLLEEVEENLHALSEDRKQVALQKATVGELERFIAEKKKKLDERERQAKAAALEEAQEIVRTTRKETERLVAEIRRSQADKKVVKETQTSLQRTAEELAAKGKELAPVVTPEMTELRIGDTVSVALSTDGAQQISGEVVELANDERKVRLWVGNIFYTVYREQIVKKVEPSAVPSSSTPPRRQLEEEKGVSRELSVRGMTVDEALAEIDKYLDGVALSGLSEVVIIHGKGTGKLRKEVGAYLKNHPLVAATRLGQWNEGGEGVTVVQMKREGKL